MYLLSTQAEISTKYFTYLARECINTPPEWDLYISTYIPYSKYIYACTYACHPQHLYPNYTNSIAKSHLARTIMIDMSRSKSPFLCIFIFLYFLCCILGIYSALGGL